jgi:cyclophilin family peptidyl-prolyl cis-trans isomerase
MPRTRTTAHHRRALAALAAGCLLLATSGAVGAEAPAAVTELTKVRIETTLGAFVIQLETVRAPITSLNFINYVKSGQYPGTIFHRVINNFIAQGGGYDDKFQLKAVGKPVANESGNGLSNKRGTVGIARSELPHSGNCQFYVNLTDNDDLDPTPLRWGYAVFGKVIEGMDIVDKIGRTPTGSVGPWSKDAPIDPVVIKRAELLGAIPAAAAESPAAPPAPPAPPPPPPPSK